MAEGMNPQTIAFRAVVCYFRTKKRAMAKDIFHDAVKASPVADGWTITDDPLFLRFDDIYYRELSVHLLIFDPTTHRIHQWKS